MTWLPEADRLVHVDAAGVFHSLGHLRPAFLVDLYVIFLTAVYVHGSGPLSRVRSPGAYPAERRLEPGRHVPSFHFSCEI